MSMRSLSPTLQTQTSEWLDPRTDLTGNGETGLEPLPKNVNFYKKSWSSGSPFKSTPSWADMSAVPPRRRAYVARPDLALNAMGQILRRVENELYNEAQHRESQRLRRQESIETLRTRHERRHEEQRKLGVAAPPTHEYAEHATRRAQSPPRPPPYQQQQMQLQQWSSQHHLLQQEQQLGASASTLPSVPPSPGALQRTASAGELTNPEHNNFDRAEYGEFGEGRPYARSPSPLIESVAGPSSPLLTMRSQHFAGLEGLLIPKYESLAGPAEGAGAEYTWGSAPDSSPPASPSHMSRASSHSRLLSSTPTLPPALVAEEAARHTPSRLSGSTSGMPSRPTTAATNASRDRPPAIGAGGSAAATAARRGLGGTATAQSLVPPPRNPTIESQYKLGWVESYGRHLGKPPRRSPFHFEGGLNNNTTPLPRPFSAASLLATATTPAASRANLLGSAVLSQTASKSQLLRYTSGTAPIPAASHQLLHNSRGPAPSPKRAKPPARPATASFRPGRVSSAGVAAAGGASNDAGGVAPSPNTITRAARALAY